MKSKKLWSHSAEETHEIGKGLGATLRPGAVVTLTGDLGAGKTTLIRGLVEGAQQREPLDVCSPTFSLLHVYEGRPTVYHFDLYRLPRPEEFFTAGFEEYLHQGGICCIEWPEQVGTLLSVAVVKIEMSYVGEDHREITIYEEGVI